MITPMPTNEFSRTHYLGVQLATLGTGIGALVAAHALTRHLGASAGGTVPTAGIVTLLIVPLALAAVARSTFVIVTSGHSDSYRIFRSRHLFATGSLLFVVGATITAAMVVHDPFHKFFAHGHITAEDVVDVSLVIAALICTVGAGVALVGAWDRLHTERHWHLSLHLYGRRQN